jgi:serine/threonine-protein kinase
MLLGRGPFVADDVAAILYQIINLAPHPLAPRVPGLPPAVEQVLRQALSKRPADRFSSMQEFSRALQSAAFGRPADTTPAPVLVSPATPASATIAYGKTPVPAVPARPPAAPTPQEGRKTDADVLQTGGGSIGALLRNRIKPIHAVVAAVGVVLLLGAFLLLRSSPAPKPAPVAAPRPTPPPATIAKPTPGPTVTPLPVPAPPPPAVSAPEPAPVRGSEAKAPAAKRLQPASPSAAAPAGAAKAPAAGSFDVDKFLREHDQRKAQAIDPTSSHRTNPFAESPGGPTGAKQPKKPVSSPATEPPRTPKRPSRNQPLIEEL